MLDTVVGLKEVHRTRYKKRGDTPEGMPPLFLLEVGEELDCHVGVSDHVFDSGG